jgi:2-polyprenyl-6-methoxyphenol hydroxylase-like FAD-dependent oxidoreductase
VESFDVIVVGARCAGSPLATALAQRGLRTCVLDRSQFPSETLSTHVIQPQGVAVLDRLGVLDDVLAAGAVSLSRFSLVTDDAQIDAAIDPEEFGGPALCIRRITLDNVLVEAAGAAGADVRTGTAVRGLLREGDRVVGVETDGGSLRARLVAGADGRRSTVADQAGAAEYFRAPAGRMFAWAYFEGVPGDGQLRLGSRGELNFVASPTDAGLYLAAVCPSLGAKDAFLAERESSYMEGLEAWPELAGLLAGASRVGPIRVMASWHGYFREAAGPGWVLLGDAGNFKDPSPAQGIADALRQAERLAEAIETGLNGTGDIDGELRRWWRWRDDDGFEMHWFATDMGAPGAPRQLAAQFMRDIAADEGMTRGFLRVLNHEVSPSRFFTLPRGVRAIARAARQRPVQIPTLAREVIVELRNQVDRSRQRSRAPSGGTGQAGGRLERLLLVLTVIGFIVPNVFVGLFLAREGLDLGGYFSFWTASLPSTQLLFDLGIAAVAFFAWAAVEGRRAQVERWWVCIPASLLVGLCFGLPLFLWMRERAIDRAA